MEKMLLWGVFAMVWGRKAYESVEKTDLHEKLAGDIKKEPTWHQNPPRWCPEASKLQKMELKGCKMEPKSTKLRPKGATSY